MSPSVSLLLLLLLGLSQALPLHEEGDGDRDGEQEGVLDAEKDGDHDGDKDKDHDGWLHAEKDGDLDGDKDHEEWHDEDKDGDRDGDKDHEEWHDEDKDGDKDGDKNHVDISKRILTINNGSDEMLLEGDIVAPKTRNAIICNYAQCLWRKGYNGLVNVPYVIGREFSSYERQLIEGAMAAFRGRTCIQFTPRTNEYDFISVVSKDGCYSELGKVGGMQELSLNKGGCMYSGIAQHELNHALGFQHEQTRSDRDSYVRINWQNIVPASAYNFFKHDTNNLNTPYDYGSIMHYGRDAFSITYGRDSITPIPNPNVPIGQRNGLSGWDIRRINLLYQC